MKEYSDDLIEEIKENIDIVDFIGEYVELTKKGREYFGKCPLHDERTGSFSVTQKMQLSILSKVQKDMKNSTTWI